MPSAPFLASRRQRRFYFPHGSSRLRRAVQLPDRPLFPRKETDEPDRIYSMKRNIKKAQAPPAEPIAQIAKRADLPWDEHTSHESSFPPVDAEGTPLAPEEQPTEDDSGPDDALGLYLRQMGAIPLLNRKEEET